MMKPDSRGIQRATLRQLRLAAAVHREASILKAARALNLSQPAASRLLRDLERDLGVVLFARSNRGVTPTPAGEALAAHAKLMLAQLAQAGEQIADLTGGTGGRVAVGTLLAASARLLPLAIARLQTERPRVRVAVVEGTNDRLVPLLAAGDLDLIVGRLPEFRFRDELALEPIYAETSVIVVRMGHPLLHRRRLTLATCAGAPWILPPPETTLRRQVERAFHDAGLAAPRPAVESLSILTNRALLTATDMIGVLPEQVVAEDVAAGRLAILPVALPTTAGPVGIGTRRDGILSPAAEALCAALRAASGTLAQVRPAPAPPRQGRARRGPQPPPEGAR